MESQFSCESETKTLEIESFLSNNAYLSGGPLPGAQDSQVFFSLKAAPEQSKYPNFFYWFATLSNFNPTVVKAWGAKKEQPQQQKGGKPEVKKEEAAKSEDVDLFGDDDGEDAAILAARKEEKQREKEEEEKKKKAKPGVIAKTIIIFDVKIIDEEQDLDALAKKVLDIKLDGLLWKTEYNKVPVAYNIKKLQMACTVEDDKVLTDDIFDIILAWEDEVQSVDVVQLQKV